MLASRQRGQKIIDDQLKVIKNSMKNILKKLYEIQGMNLRFEKSAENPFFKSKYLPLEAIQEKLNPVLQEKGLVVFHQVRDNNVVTVVGETESGDALESAFPLPAGLDPQKVGSAITYGKRYNLGALFNIITDEDDDGNVTAQKPKKINKDEDIGF